MKLLPKRKTFLVKKTLNTIEFFLFLFCEKYNIMYNYVMRKNKLQLRSNRLYPLFRMLTWDLVLYYIFNVLFLTQVKGFSSADMMYMTTVSAFTVILLQFPIKFLGKKIGEMNTIRLGMIMVLIFSIVILFANNIYILYFNQIIYATASAMLSPFVPSIGIKNLKQENREDEYSKLEGKGISYYNLIAAIGGISLGYVYNFNPYVAMSLPIVFCVIGVIVTFIVKDESKNKTKFADKSQEVLEAQIKPQNEKQEKQKFFTLPMILFTLVLISFFGILFIESNLKQLMYQEVLFGAVAIGWINFAIRISKMLSTYFYKFFSRNTNKNLIVFPMIYLFINLCLGLCMYFIPSLLARQIILIIFILLMASFNDSYKILTKDYIRLNINEKMHAAAFSYLNVLKNISKLIFSFIMATLLLTIPATHTLLYMVAISVGMLLISTCIYQTIKAVTKKRHNKQITIENLQLETEEKAED